MAFDPKTNAFTDGDLEYIARELRSTPSEVRNSLEMWGPTKRAALYHSFTFCDDRCSSLSDRLTSWECLHANLVFSVDFLWIEDHAAEIIDDYARMKIQLLQGEGDPSKLGKQMHWMRVGWKHYNGSDDLPELATGRTEAF